jgi:hypothetical protein
MPHLVRMVREEIRQEIVSEEKEKIMAELAVTRGPPRSQAQKDRDALRHQIGVAKAKMLALDEASRCVRLCPHLDSTA